MPEPWISALSLQAEAELVGELRERRSAVGHAPHGRLHHVPARRKRNAVALIHPVFDSAAMRTARDELTVEREVVALVAGDVKFKRRAVAFELAFEAHDARKQRIRHLILDIGMREPRRLVDRLHRQDRGIAAGEARGFDHALHGSAISHCRSCARGGNYIQFQDAYRFHSIPRFFCAEAIPRRKVKYSKVHSKSQASYRPP